VVLAAAALLPLQARRAEAFAPLDPKVSALAAESIECRERGCKQAALNQLKSLLEVSAVEKNAKGEASAHDLQVVKCLAALNPDDPDAPIRVKVKVVAEAVDMMDYVAVIWLANKSSGDILSARAMAIQDEGAPTIRYDLFFTGEELLRIKDDVLVPRLYCAEHGLWEGSEFTLSQYLIQGGLDLPR